MKILKNIISFVLTMFIVFMGSVSMTYYVTSEITLKSAFAGLLGVILLLPAFNKWEERFDKFVKNQD